MYENNSEISDFTDDEIREELAKLGYNHISEERLKDFKKDLDLLVRKERSKQNSQNTSVSSHRSTDEYAAANRVIQKERVPLEETSVQNGFHPPSQDYRTVYISGKENFGSDDLYSFKKPLPPDPLTGLRPGQYSLYETDVDRRVRPDIRDDISESGSEKRFVKRKVLRRSEKGSKYIDESFTESDTSSILDVNDRLQQLGIRDDGVICRRPTSARTEPPYRLDPDDPRPASVILRPAEHPHTKAFKKSDPVNRYHQFRESWNMYKTPGEKSRKDLRWSIREQMSVQDVLEKKPQKVFVPNKYVVPTEKQRKNLRWQVRMDMAQGNMPVNGYHDPYG